MALVSAICSSIHLALSNALLSSRRASFSDGGGAGFARLTTRSLESMYARLISRLNPLGAMARGDAFGASDGTFFLLLWWLVAPPTTADAGRGIDDCDELAAVPAAAAAAVARRLVDCGAVLGFRRRAERTERNVPTASPAVLLFDQPLAAL